MNKKQRNQNRANARAIEANAHVCSECGERGLHWIGLPATLQNVMDDTEPDGFWTCPKFYGPDGRRIE